MSLRIFAIACLIVALATLIYIFYFSGDLFVGVLIFGACAIGARVASSTYRRQEQLRESALQEYTRITPADADNHMDKDRFIKDYIKKNESSESKKHSLFLSLPLWWSAFGLISARAETF